MYRNQSTGCAANQLTGFCGVHVFTEWCFWMNYLYFWAKIFALIIFCILTANFSGLMCQDVLLLIGLQIIFVLILIQLCQLFSLQVLNNLLMILTSIYRFNKFQCSVTYIEVFTEFLFLCFPMLIDNNIWYVRVGIFHCLIRYVSPTVRHCCDINFFINLLNKTKSYLALFLSFLIFCVGVTVLFLFIYISLALFIYQN